jgi:NAD(P)-dependent dehydrogenase (short-subunit alcohol dehydrogenase family)
MPTVLITGANRGIGLEFARQYSADGWTVIATARQSSAELESAGVRIEPLDLSDADAVAGFPGKIDAPLDLFIANAGTNQPMNTGTAEDARDWQAMMMINAIAPYQLGQALLPRLAEANGKAIAISSGMGSIGDNGGGWVPYRTSKAALNMAWSCLALEAKPKGVTAVRGGSADHQRAERRRHAAADRPVVDRGQRAIPSAKRVRTALVGCLAGLCAL